MLNAYMAFSRNAGSEEGAVLVFAHSVQEARVVGWKLTATELTDEYIDFGAKRIRHSPWLIKEAIQIKLLIDEPHVIDEPLCCAECGLWGQSPIGEDGFCEDCRDLQEEDEEDEYA